jgi:PEGA domain
MKRRQEGTKMNLKHMLVMPVLAAIASAQVVIPDGTKMRLRLDQTLSSATADEGQTVELSVAESVTVDGVTVVQEGSRATGTVVVAQEKRRMGRAGKLDFSVDRVRGVNGQWLPVRYTLTKKEGDSKAVSTGVITAGVAVVFWPAAPFVLMRHGKDTTINKGLTFDVFVDGNHTLNPAQAPASVASATQVQPVRPAALTAPAVMTVAAPMTPTPAITAPVNPAEQATLAVTSAEPGADIEINGSFVGSTPTAVKVGPGQYTVAVRRGTQVWQRVLQVNAGSSVTLNAIFEKSDNVAIRRSRNN